MPETENQGRWAKLRRLVRRPDFWMTVSGLAVTVVIMVGVVLRWRGLPAIETYGYLGAFIISVFGGATILAPIPMTPTVFFLGSVMKPAAAPAMGPILVGLAAGLGETVGGIIIYMTGYGGGTALLTRKNTKLEKAYARVLRWMQRRGPLILFVLSAVINPFFYPAAITAGALRFGLRRFILITWAGKTIKGITVAAAGYWGLGALLRALGLPV